MTHRVPFLYHPSQIRRGMLVPHRGWLSSRSIRPHWESSKRMPYSRTSTSYRSQYVIELPLMIHDNNIIWYHGCSSSWYPNMESKIPNIITKMHWNKTSDKEQRQETNTRGILDHDWQWTHGHDNIMIDTRQYDSLRQWSNDYKGE
jgi:hypothetical protein